MLFLSLMSTFQVEMEFVQSLANPNYLHFLAQRGFMKDPCFVNYLNYLTYWKVGENHRDSRFNITLLFFQEPAYVCFLKYPVCLHFLELLQHETFRKEIVSGQCARFLDDQVFAYFAFLQHCSINATIKVILQWQHYTRRRAKLFEAATNQVNIFAQDFSNSSDSELQSGNSTAVKQEAR